MTTTRERILTAAEPVFDRHGFAGTGIDRLTDAVGVSSRTLYKHLGSKTGLVAAVLDARRERFEAGTGVTTVDGLFDALASWVDAEGARGCLFLRALGEDGRSHPEIAAAVDVYRAGLHATVSRVAAHEIGRADEDLAEELLVLFEGAVSAASYRGARAVAAARAAAHRLVTARHAA